MSMTIDVLNSANEAELNIQKEKKLSKDLLISACVGLLIIAIFIGSGVYDPVLIGLLSLVVISFFTGHRLLQWGYSNISRFLYFSTPIVVILSFGFLFPPLKLEGLLFVPLIIDSFSHLHERRSLIALNVLLLLSMGTCLGLEILVHGDLYAANSFKLSSVVILLTAIGLSAVNLQQIITDPRYYIKKLLSMEAELNNSNQKYFALFHNTSEAILILNATTYDIIESNPALENLVGKSNSIITNVQDLIDGEPMMIFQNLVLQVSHDKKAYCDDLELNKCPKKFGNMVQVQCTIIPYSPSNNQIAVIFHDLTERQATFEALQESESRLRTIIEGSPAAIVHTDVNGNILLASSNASDIHGMTKESLVGHNVEEIIFKEDKGNDMVKKLSEELLAKKKTNISTKVHNDRNEIKHVEGTVSPTMDIYGVLSGYLFAYNDTSDVMRAEARQLEQGLIFQSLVVNSFAGIDIIQCTNLDPDEIKGQIVVRNPKMIKILENTNDTLIGLDGFLALTTDENSTQEEISETTTKYYMATQELVEKKSHSGQMIFKINGKHKVINIISHLIDINDKIFLVRMFSDVTALKRQEEEILAKNSQLEKYIESNMNLANFAATASHDLISPLRTINSFASLLNLKERDAFTPKGQQFLDIILSSSNQMSAMVEDLYTFSKINSKKINIAPINMEGLVLNVLNSIHVEIEQKKAIVEIKNMPILIKGDEVKISQVFLNLIRNGIKFRTEDKLPKIQIDYTEDDTHWHFTVQDNGIGICKKYQADIFTIFQKLHSQDKYEGSGIGLAICSKVVEAHNGRIWVESELGQGSTFHFTIQKSLP